jgi:uncharacterized membrane protein YoaK (UPF0700 family)
LLALAISAWVKWRMAASAALLAIFFVGAVLAQVINNLFVTRLGNLISLQALIGNVWADLFGNFHRQAGHVEGFVDRRMVNVPLFEPPLWASVATLLLICAFCLFLLARRIKAYEVVR